MRHVAGANDPDTRVYYVRTPENFITGNPGKHIIGCVCLKKVTVESGNGPSTMWCRGISILSVNEPAFDLLKIRGQAYGRAHQAGLGKVEPFHPNVNGIYTSKDRFFQVLTEMTRGEDNPRDFILGLGEYGVRLMKFEQKIVGRMGASNEEVP